MEKALDTPSNVMIYKQHWDYYARTPGLLDKLKTEQPVQHHLLQHFRQNFWHLVENLEKLKTEPQQQKLETQQHQPQASYGGQERDHLRPGSGLDSLRDSQSFGRQFGADESSIARELDSYHQGALGGEQRSLSPVLPERLTPLMFSRPHVCARMSASGLLVKVEPNSPRVSEDYDTSVSEDYDTRSTCNCLIYQSKATISYISLR